MNKIILLGHGGGGRLTRDFIHQEICSRFGKGPLATLADAARLGSTAEEIIFTTDSFVVNPLAFPGGDIGTLAVYGTVNDIAVAGGRPRWLSLGLILEEGFPLDRLRTILDSIQTAAERCDVVIATGDTKVVRRGQCDGVYINTSGIGTLIPGLQLSANNILPEDTILVSGSLGDHGMAVMMKREGMQISNGPQSDLAPVYPLTHALARFKDQIRFMRDPTRGGLAAVLHEVCEGRPIGIEIEERALPLAQNSKALAEMMGLDLLHVASEGRVVLFCAPDAAMEILATWRSLPQGKDAAIIGKVMHNPKRIYMKSAIGGLRMIDLPNGELLPRIC